MNKLILKTTKSGLLAAALMASISASAETIEVKTLKYAGPYAVAQPWMADSVNIKGEAFDLKQLLDSPLSFTLLNKGKEVSAAQLLADKQDALHLASFCVSNTQRTKATIAVEGLEQYRLHSPYDDTNEEKATITGDQNEFTQEQVEATWFSMCMRMQNKLDFIGLANRMKSIVPKITNYPQIEVIINNQLLLDDVLNIKNRILKTFVLGLHNSELSISYRLADQEEVGKVLTKNEVLELLMEKNPAMKKLTKDLDLVMT